MLKSQFSHSDTDSETVSESLSVIDSLTHRWLGHLLTNSGVSSKL